jgi:hypothetical protein
MRVVSLFQTLLTGNLCAILTLQVPELAGGVSIFCGPMNYGINDIF